MNCKEGDLAFVTAGAKSRDRIVRCIRLVSDGEMVPLRDGGMREVATEGSKAWLIEGWVLLGNSDGSASWIAAVADCFLRPIRDPGDDAVDEMLLRVGAPEGQTA